MISEQIKHIVKVLCSQGKMHFLDAATDDQIDQFEKETHLPLKFKEWLLFSDGGECFLPAGVQIYGVAHKPLIDIADDDRPNENYIVIGALASGDPILCEKNSERISIFNHGAGRIESNETYDDFHAFLKDLPGILGIGG